MTYMYMYTLHHDVQASETGRVGSSHQLKKGAAKLSEGTTYIHQKVHHGTVMELRIQQKIGKKYGGLTHANQAAIVVQTAYRQYQLKKLYDEIRKKRSMLHKLKQLRPSRLESRHVVDQKSIKHTLSAIGKEAAKNKSGPVVSVCLKMWCPYRAHWLDR